MRRLRRVRPQTEMGFMLTEVRRVKHFTEVRVQWRQPEAEGQRGCAHEACKFFPYY